MKKAVYILLAVFVITSCKTALDHVKIAQKHIAKAAVLDPSIKLGPDPVVTFKTDTLIKTEIIDGTVTITKTITVEVEKDCPEYDFSGLKTNSQTRQEEKTKRKEKKEDRKIAINDKDEQTKQVKSDNRTEVKLDKGSLFWTFIGKLFWVFFIGGMLLGIYLTLRFKRCQ